MALFTHEDDEGDELEVMEALNDHRGQLVFNFNCSGCHQGVFVTHDRVAALHAALGAWLELKDPMQSSVVENSLIDQLIVRRVAEEVARVLPLHQAPQADTELRCDYDCSGCHQDDDGDDRVPEEPKYVDAGSVTTVMANRLLSELTRMADVAKRSAQTIQESSRVWGTDGTSPNGPVPECTECNHRYAMHGIGGRPECHEFACRCPEYKAPNGPVPQCQARGCGHEYAQHIEYADSRPGYKQCTECACVRYRSQA